jgi:hypothetical protein
MAAAVDFAAIEQTYLDAVDELVAGLDTLRADQIADLVEQVRAAGDDLEQLAQVSTDPVGATRSPRAMRAIADSPAPTRRSARPATRASTWPARTSPRSRTTCRRARTRSRRPSPSTSATRRRAPRSGCRARPGWRATWPTASRRT